jgi:outer membrane protein assembly factor BamD (BamD/ComL family)
MNYQLLNNYAELKKYLKGFLTILLLLSCFELSAVDPADIQQKFEQAEILYQKADYQGAIQILEEIKTALPNTDTALQAELEIMKNSYYDWDLKQAAKIGLTLIELNVNNNQVRAKIIFYAYWWLINTFTAQNDSKKLAYIQNELINFYEVNRGIINDEKCGNIYEKIVKKVRG